MSIRLNRVLRQINSDEEERISSKRHRDFFRNRVGIPIVGALLDQPAAN